FNVGARESNTQEGGSGPIIVTDTLPPGVTAKKAGEFIQPGREEEGEHGFGTDPEIESGVWDCTGNGGGPPPGVEGANVVTCTSDPVGLITFQGGGGLPTFLPTTNSDNNPQPVVGIAVEANTPAAGLTNHASIEGGGAPGPAAPPTPVPVSANPRRAASSTPTPGSPTPTAPSTHRPAHTPTPQRSRSTSRPPSTPTPTTNSTCPDPARGTSKRMSPRA